VNKPGCPVQVALVAAGRGTFGLPQSEAGETLSGTPNRELLTISDAPDVSCSRVGMTMLSRRAWSALALLAFVTTMTLLALLAGLSLVTLIALLAGLSLHTLLSLLARLPLCARLSGRPLHRRCACIATANKYG